MNWSVERQIHDLKTQKTYLIILKQMLQIKGMENTYEINTTQSDNAIE